MRRWRAQLLADLTHKRCQFIVEALGGLGDSLRAIADPELKAVLGALAAGVAGSDGIPRIGKIG